MITVLSLWLLVLYAYTEKRSVTSIRGSSSNFLSISWCSGKTKVMLDIQITNTTITILMEILFCRYEMSIKTVTGYTSHHNHYLSCSLQIKIHFDYSSLFDQTPYSNTCQLKYTQIFRFPTIFNYENTISVPRNIGVLKIILSWPGMDGPDSSTLVGPFHMHFWK